MENTLSPEKKKAKTRIQTTSNVLFLSLEAISSISLFELDGKTWVEFERLCIWFELQGFVRKPPFPSLKPSRCCPAAWQRMVINVGRDATWFPSTGLVLSNRNVASWQQSHRHLCFSTHEPGVVCDLFSLLKEWEVEGGKPAHCFSHPRQPWRVCQLISCHLWLCFERCDVW